MTPSDGGNRADRYMLIGAVLSGLPGPSLVGLPLLLYGLYLEYTRVSAGQAKRPLVLTALATWGLANGVLNLFAASMVLFAHDHWVFKAAAQYFGTHVDYRWWIWGYNSAAWGGVADQFETTYNIWNLIFFFPMYVVANYGFFRMKKWGYTWCLISSWIFVWAWFIYVTYQTVGGNKNYLDTTYPIWGWWVMNGPYLTPFFAIPYLHTVNKEIFT